MRRRRRVRTNTLLTLMIVVGVMIPLAALLVIATEPKTAPTLVVIQ